VNGPYSARLAAKRLKGRAWLRRSSIRLALMLAAGISLVVALGMAPRQKGDHVVRTVEQVQELRRRWAEAEMKGDVKTLDSLATADFTLVGPLGFVLKKEQWLDRYRSGTFVTKSLKWADVEVRDYGDAAVAVGVHDQEASYQGNPSDGRFRATHIAVRDGDRWLLAGMHLSPIAPPPGAPGGRPS
jgi:ketosteroid isomerase-like protein